MTPAALARHNAIPLEIKKDGLQQRQNGDWVLRFVVQACDMDERITKAAMGTRFQAALVIIGDDELPVQKEVMPNPEQRSNRADVSDRPNNAQPQPKDKPAGAKRPKQDWQDMQPSAQASMLCDKPVFQAFLREKYSDDWLEAMSDPDECVRLICAVESKSMLNDGVYRVIWHTLQSEFKAWELMP